MSTKQYYIAAGRDLCPDGNEKLASGSVFMVAKHCSSIGGDYLVTNCFAMGSFRFKLKSVPKISNDALCNVGFTS